MFGTPDDAYVFPESGLDLAKIELAAGTTGGDASGRQRGLYRQHCVHCHGINGDGAGPTASFLTPYPRDYRKGIYKFKSTQRGNRPTTADLERTLRQGIPGTAMPSFLLLPSDEIEALVEYVKYLSYPRRSRERHGVRRLRPGGTLEMNHDSLVSEYLEPVTTSWQAADAAVIQPAEHPAIDT